MKLTEYNPVEDALLKYLESLSQDIEEIQPYVITRSPEEIGTTK